MPEMVDSERTKESLLGYIHEKLHGAEEEHEEVEDNGSEDLYACLFEFASGDERPKRRFGDTTTTQCLS